MRDGMAETVAEAEAQTLVLPKFEDWRQFALLLDGYMIAEELGLSFHEWGAQREQHWEETGRWDLDVMQLRVMMFYCCRREYWTDWYGNQHDQLADSLLWEFSRMLNLPYAGRTETED